MDLGCQNPPSSADPCPCRRVQMKAPGAHAFGQKAGFAVRNVADGHDADSLQTRLRLGSDADEFLGGQGPYFRLQFGRPDERQAVRFLQTRRKLGEVFVPRDADGTRQTRLFTNGGLDLAARIFGHREVARLAQVDVTFVNSRALRLAERSGNAEDMPRYGRIMPVIHREKDGVGTALPRLGNRHGGLDTVFSGFVVGRAHHASAVAVVRIRPDDDGLSLQFGPALLLDLGEKTVHVQVGEDGLSASRRRPFLAFGRFGSPGGAWCGVGCLHRCLPRDSTGRRANKRRKRGAGRWGHSARFLTRFLIICSGIFAF